MSVLDQLIAAQHGIFAIKLVLGWNFGVNVQGTSLRAVVSSVRLVRVTSKAVLNYYSMSVDLAHTLYHAAFAQALRKPRGLGGIEWV